MAPEPPVHHPPLHSLKGTTVPQDEVTITFRVIDPIALRDKAVAAYLASGGGDPANVDDNFGPPDRPDLPGCVRELIGDRIDTEAAGISDFF